MLGELIGVEYLYQQTGEVAKVYKSAIQELETADVCVAEDESYVEPVDFDDLTLSTFDEEEPPRVLPSTSCAVPSENPHVLPPAPLVVPPVLPSAPSTVPSENPRVALCTLCSHLTFWSLANFTHRTVCSGSTMDAQKHV